MGEPIVFGAAYSVYVRIVRLALVEKAVPYRLVEVDIFGADAATRAEYSWRHPFGRIPAFEHDGFALYETGAITRYVDEAFDGPPLQPTTPRERARVNQIIGILDNYAYRTLVREIFVERVRAPMQGRATDEAIIHAAMPQALTCLHALTTLMADAPWLAGPALTLADLHAAPMFVYFMMTDEGRTSLAQHPPLERWWQRLRARSSMAATRSPLEF